MAERPGEALRRELLALFRRGASAPLPEERFRELALRVFAHQFELNHPYRAYCLRRGATPDSVRTWQRIPAVPTSAYKEVVLVAGEPALAEAVFRTSGTTRGTVRRGAHHVMDLRLYRASLLAGFEAFVLPDGARPTMLSLLAPANEMPDSSLSHMVSVVLERLGGRASGWFGGAAGVDERRLEEALRRQEVDDSPVCLLGTSFDFVHWLDSLRDRGLRFRLPAGSRLMDTGGYKGRTREVAQEDMRVTYEELLGIPASHQVNEYGMTELLSQYYDAGLHDAVRGFAGLRDRRLAPPWLRAVVADPETLEPLPRGETGILRHLDLANLDSVAAVQTEDLGREVDGGLLLLGRATGAPPRGCSIAADLLIEAARSTDGETA